MPSTQRCAPPRPSLPLTAPRSSSITTAPTASPATDGSSPRPGTPRHQLNTATLRCLLPRRSGPDRRPLQRMVQWRTV
ncbi:hypothetical protein Ae331Ps2_6365c [Pseudonocardia sp. Ae331_Ps2]|nr:hypothetical protein Ae331Ps2_6365c [Pseudonocardia sp. Ae331_Ps2]